MRSTGPGTARPEAAARRRTTTPRSDDPPGGVDRRAFLLASGGLATAVAGAGVAGALAPGAPAAAAPARPAHPRPAQPAAHGPYTEGTTVAGVATPHGSGGYRRLGEGPGWPRLRREEFAAGQTGREGRRTVLASFVQLTDLHLTDAQSPLRFEYLRAAAVNSWKPQEALSVAGIVSLIERVNSLPGGPATGSPLSFVISTGDNCDNNESVELDWFLTAMNGGRIEPNTGDPNAYEGVQNSGLPLYWQPQDALRDQDKRLGFPRVPGYLDAAIRGVTSPGLRLPWYSTAGNHDGLVGGCYALTDSYFTDIATGSLKLESVPTAEAARILTADAAGRDVKGDLLRHLFRTYRGRARTVTSDPRRAPFSRRDYLTAHLDPGNTGPGPSGHGFTGDNLEGDHLYYTFRISDTVLGVSLDTTDRAGDSPGSVGSAQLAWLEKVLTQAGDQRVLVFSHHTRPDPAAPGEKRHTGAEVLALLGRHRNVLAWLNGHIHQNRITPREGFWEISTASHVDYPQLARVVEVADNHDGTLSVFTTLVESAAPHRTDFADLSPSGLASLYREVSFNRPDGSTALAGLPGDRNTELLLRA
jgi:metallophosphoesterase (TIGR03767 family)